MKQWSLLAGGIAALAAAVLAVGPIGAMGASAVTKTPDITASIRVSNNCTVTITGHWSDLSFPPDQTYSSVSDGTYSADTDTPSTAVRNGNFKDDYTATPSARPNTITGEVAVHDATDGWVSATVSTTAYCSGPFM